MAVRRFVAPWVAVRFCPREFISFFLFFSSQKKYCQRGKGKFILSRAIYVKSLHPRQHPWEQHPYNTKCGTVQMQPNNAKWSESMRIHCAIQIELQIVNMPTQIVKDQQTTMAICNRVSWRLPFVDHVVRRTKSNRRQPWRATTRQ